jgi:CubicO group peptidase (beta-lactamase class C family)
MSRGLRWTTVLLAISLYPCGAVHAETTPSDAFDGRVKALMLKYDIPAGAVAVAKDERLVYAEGFGCMDRSSDIAVRPDSLFRIASVSKPITCVAVLRLVDAERLKLDDRAFDHLPQFKLDDIPELDKRIRAITVRQLLEHSGGWDRDVEFDPMFRAVEIAEELHEPAPAKPDTVIRYMLCRKLDFDPGARTAYSNFGYCILGRIIETVTGKSYEQAVQELVLTPAGIHRMKLGKSRLAERAPDEVRYDDEAEGETTASVFPEDREPVSWCYGGFCLEAMDAHGGWLASPIDLVRFATAVDGRRGQTLLTPDLLREMANRPSYAPEPSDGVYMGLCWNFRDAGQDKNWWHTGSLPGTSSLLVRTHHGFAWAAVFNDRPAKGSDRNAFHNELDALFWQGIDEIDAWPSEDLFLRFP